MVRASKRPDGITAPMWSGFSIHERRKRTSSSRRSGFFNARTDDCNGMSLPGGTACAAKCQKTVINTYSELTIRSSQHALSCVFQDIPGMRITRWKNVEKEFQTDRQRLIWAPQNTRAFLYELARLPKKSLTLAKKPAASG